MKNKKALAMILSAVMALGSYSCVVPAAAAAETETIQTVSNDDLRQFVQIGPMFFRCDLEHAVLVSCNKEYEGELEIPAYVQGKPVTTLGYACLAECYGITKLTIPDTVAVINNHALYRLELKELTFPVSLTTLAPNAVWGLDSLDKVTFQSPWFEFNLWEGIGSNFRIDGGCTGPDVNEKMIICGYKESDAEHLAEKLGCEFYDETTEEGRDVIIADGTWKDGFCFDVDSENNEAKLVGCDMIKVGLEMKIPSEVDGVPVTEIGDNALRGKYWISMEIPDTVRRIGDEALGNSYYGSTVVIPESVEYIGKNCFTGGFTNTKGVKFMSADTKVDEQNFTVFDIDPSGGTYFLDRDCIIYGKAGSEAEKLAQDKGLKFIVIEEKETVYGDANLDGAVDISDSVAIMQAIAIPEKAALSPEAAKNADVAGTGDGITNKDALAVQNYMLGLITSLPE